MWFQGQDEKFKILILKMYFNVKCTVLKSNALYFGANALDLNILNLVRKSEIFV